MTASHSDYNFWIIDRNTGRGPFSIRMTDIYGHTATATNVKLSPQKVQTTSVSLTGKVAVKHAERKATVRPSPPPPATASPAAPAPEATTQAANPALSAPSVNLAAAPAKAKKCG
jgi:hypothetical protein